MATQVKTNRIKYLISDKALPRHVADQLLQDRILNQEEYDRIIHEKTGFDISRALVDSVIRKGDVASAKFLRAWQAYSEPSMSFIDILNILDDLRDSELKLFTWHMRNTQTITKRVPFVM